MRVLVVLSEPHVPRPLGERCQRLIGDGHDVALCYSSTVAATIDATLDAQRKITADLRRTLENSAETIPVFVVTGQSGDGIDDCARAWGATDIWP